MLSKSKANITNNLSQMSAEEAVRGLLMSVSLLDRDQSFKIFDRLSENDKKLAIEQMQHMMYKIIFIQELCVFKAIMAVDYYTRTIDLESGIVNPIEEGEYERNLAYQEDLERQIREIDDKTKGIAELPVIEDIYQGLTEYFDHWVVHAFRMSQKLGLLPKDIEEAKKVIKERAEKLEVEKRAKPPIQEEKSRVELSLVIR